MSHSLVGKKSIPSKPRFFSTVLFALLFSASAIADPSIKISDEPAPFNKCWEFSVSANLDVGIAAGASSVYFVDDENKLHGIDIAAGSQVWSGELGGTVASNILVLDDSILLTTNSRPADSNASPKSTVRALSPQTGITEWSAEVPTSPTVWLGSMGRTVVAVGSDGQITAMNRRDGKLVWKTQTSSRVTAAPYFNESRVEIATNKNEVLKVAGSDGQTSADWKAAYLPTAILLDVTGRLMVGDERGNLISVTSNGNRSWGFRNGAQISSITSYGSEYLVASYDNFIYKLSRGGDVKWKRRLSGRVNDRPLVLGDTGVVAIIGTGSVYILDLKNGKITNRIEMGDEISMRVARVKDDGFSLAGPRGISYFSSAKCSAK